MKTVDRRKFLKVAGAGSAAAVVAGCEQPAAPAIVESMPTIRWRLTSSFPKSLDTIYGAAETFTKYVRDMTDGRFTIQQCAPGHRDRLLVVEIRPRLRQRPDHLDVVRNERDACAALDERQCALANEIDFEAEQRLQQAGCLDDRTGGVAD